MAKNEPDDGASHGSSVADLGVAVAEVSADELKDGNVKSIRHMPGLEFGIAAWNACWYRNDWFRRSYCNSPTFSDMRGGNQLMSLVRKCETRPIRTYLTVGTAESAYSFGDSFFVTEDAAEALRNRGGGCELPCVKRGEMKFWYNGCRKGP